MAGKFEIKTGKTGKVRFNLKAPNGRIILTSEAYESRTAAVKGVRSVKLNAGNDSRFERKTAKDGSAYFVLKASNGEMLARSELFTSPKRLEDGIKMVKRDVENAELVTE